MNSQNVLGRNLVVYWSEVCFVFRTFPAILIGLSWVSSVHLDHERLLSLPFHFNCKHIVFLRCITCAVDKESSGSPNKGYMTVLCGILSSVALSWILLSLFISLWLLSLENKMLRRPLWPERDWGNCTRTSFMICARHSVTLRCLNRRWDGRHV
jgi:hypothetical protein